MSFVKESVNRVRNIDEVDRVNKRVGRTVFKNTNGAINNLAGRAKIAKASLLSDYDSTGDPRAAQLDSQGFVELGQVVDEETISSIREQYEDLLDSEHAYALREYDGEVYSRAVSRIHERLPELGDLLTDDVKSIVQEYYGSYVDVKHLHAWRNYHAPEDVLRETEIYSDSWHCDAMVTDVVKLFVNLSDVTEEDGPFHTLSRDYSRTLVDDGYERNRNRMPDEFVDEAHVAKATGPAGTGMLCTTWNCFHRAGHIAEGHTRDIVQFQFVPSAEPLPDDPAGWLGGVRIHPSEKQKT